MVIGYSSLGYSFLNEVDTPLPMHEIRQILNPLPAFVIDLTRDLVILAQLGL
jgi:hypothetical protein